LLEIPNGVDDAVDWPKNVVTHRRNPQSEFADSGEFREELFAIEEPRIRQLIGGKSPRCLHEFGMCGVGGRNGNINLRIVISVLHEGHSLRFYMTYIV